MIPYSYPISGWRDKLVSYNGINFEYDNLGNPTKYMNNTLVWSHGRQLVKFGDIAEYTYNANGIRTSKKTNGFTTLYYLSDDKIIRQHDQLNVLDFYYGIDGISGFHISSQNAVYKGTPLNHYFYYKKNLQGDIIGIIDADGEEIVHYVYDAWGNHKAIDGKTGSTLDISSYDSYTNTSNIVQFIATKNPFRYRSYYYDYETGLYYLNSRYYNPEIGRFINADDVEYLDADTINGLNLYAYCGSNPIMYSDPSGHFALLACILGLIALAGMGLTIGGVASGNNTLTAIGLTMVAAPALISGGMAISLLTPVGLGVGLTSTLAGVGTGLFASAEYQEAFTGNNWMLDAGMSEEWYNGLMLATASLATLGTFASSFTYSFNINSIQKIGKVDNYYGIKFTQKAPSGNLRVKTLGIHPAHNGHPIHWQLNNINPVTGGIGKKIRWDLLLRRLIGK